MSSRSISPILDAANEMYKLHADARKALLDDLNLISKIQFDISNYVSELKTK